MPLRHRIRRSIRSQVIGKESAEVVLLLLLLLVVFFWPAVFTGRVLLPADLIFEIDPLWQPLAPEGYTHASNRVLSDQIYYVLPLETLTSRLLAETNLPLWNPHIRGGVPLLGNAQSAIFSPFNLVGYLFPLNSSHVIEAILHLLVAGLFMYLFAREVGCSRPGAMFAMVAFAFSGPMVLWVGYPISPVIAWLPAMMWTVERALVRRSSLYVIACGLTIAAQFLGGHPETSFHVMLAWAAYGLYRTITLEGWQLSRLFPQLIRIVVAGIIGVLLAAVQLLPFAEALLQSAMLATRQAEASTGISMFLVKLFADWRQWPTAVTALLPHYFGVPYDNSYLYPYSNYIEQNAYVGIIPLTFALAVVGRSLKRRSHSKRPLVIFFALVAFISLGIALGLPLLNGINTLPLFNITANRRMRLIYVFAVAMLAGVGLDEFRRGQRDFDRVTPRILALLALISLLLISTAYISLLIFEDDIIRLGHDFVESQWGTPYYSQPLEHYYTQVENLYTKRLASFLPTNVTMYLPILVALAGWVLYRIGKRLDAIVGVWTYTALGLTLLDLFLTGMPFNPTIAPEHIFPTPGAVNFLQQDHGVYRVVGTGLTLYPNSCMIFGLSDVRGYETVVTRRYSDLVDSIEDHYRHGINSLFTSADAALLDLLNVKYVLTDQEMSGRWELVFEGASDMKVYRNQQVLPRAFVVHHAEVVRSADESLMRVTDSNFDFRESVVLEDSPAGWEEPAEQPATSTAQIVAYEPNRLEVLVDNASDGWLVLTDTYAPGWKATLDGEERRIYVADHAFRAVSVPAGTHRIEFVYQPLSFTIGLGISLFVCAGTAAATLVLFLNRRQAARGQQCH